MFYPTFLALAAFIVSLIGTKLLIIRLRGSSVFADVPNARSSHTTAVPKGGGIAVVTTIFIYFLSSYSDHYILLLAMVVLAGVSLLNDIMPINPLARLLTHFVVIGAMVSVMDVSIFAPFLPAWLDGIIITIGWVWFMNLFNFMDGIDGLAASESFCISGGIALILAFSGLFTSGIAYEALIVLGAVAGFWWWNQHPAKIFLGDVGSIPLGFLLGFLLLKFADAGFAPAAAILPAYFVMDATVTLIKRAWERKPLMQAHKEHFYQQAASQLGHHGIIVQLVTGLNLLLIALAHLSVVFGELYWLCIVLAYAAAGIWCLTFASISKHLNQLKRNQK